MMRAPCRIERPRSPSPAPRSACCAVGRGRRWCFCTARRAYRLAAVYGDAVAGVRGDRAGASGFGQSDDPPWLDTVADLAYFHLDLLAALGLDRVHLMGTSLGGWIAAEMAVRNTARLQSLTLVCAVGVTANGEAIPDIFRMPVEENLRRYFADPETATRRLADLGSRPVDHRQKPRDRRPARLQPALPQPASAEMAAPDRRADPPRVGCARRPRAARIRRRVPCPDPRLAAGCARRRGAWTIDEQEAGFVAAFREFAGCA